MSEDVKMESFEDPWLEDWTSTESPEPGGEVTDFPIVPTTPSNINVRGLTQYDNIGESATKDSIRTYLQGKQFDRSVYMTVLHNSATPASDDQGLATVKAFSNWHIYHNGWKAIGYHFVIDKWGTIWAGRKMGLLGSHAGPTGNPGSIGVCMTGNFEESDVPTEAQRTALAALHTALCDLYYGGASRRIRFHREFMNTACPGKLTVDQVMGWVNSYAPVTPPAGASVPIYEGTFLRGYATVVGNTSYTPVRQVFEAMGFKVEWIAAKSVANLTSPGKTPIPVGNISGTDDKPKAVVDGTLAGACISLNGKTYAPVRAIFETAGYLVKWTDDGIGVTKAQ